MNVPIIIVDDSPDRAQGFIRGAISTGGSVTWLRPEPKTSYAGAPVNFEKRLKNRNQLIESLSCTAETPRSIWLWDLSLNFSIAGEKITDADYKILATNQMLRNALHKLLNNGHVIALISSSVSTVLIRNDWLKSNPDWGNRILDFTEDWDVLGGAESEHEKKQWVFQVIAKCLNAINSKGILSLFNDDMLIKHFKPLGLVLNGENAADVTGAIPHDFDENSWPVFAPVICKVLGIEQNHPAWNPVLEPALKGNFQGYFQSLKTLIGDSAKSHVGKGYPPCLGALPILLLRAALQSNMWDTTDLTIFSNINPENCKENLKYLCSERQPMAKVQAWLAIVADKLFPILVTNHARNGKAEIESLELQCESGFFRICYAGIWSELARKVHDLKPDAGSTYQSILEAASALGDCGGAIGRDTCCVINAYIVGNRTCIEFCVTT